MMKPRPFNHKPIFIDERKERLAQVEQRARGEASAVKPSALEGVFTSRQQQRKSAIQLSVPMLLSVLLILLATVLLIVFSR
ncbi:MAG: hypothetical protein IKG77_05600 [Prevotella sp.]|nr:hypothetical protein [Prevotella sp.]